MLGIDLVPVEAVAGAELHVLDFLADGADALVRGWLGGPADVVLSDMAAPASGHPQTDALRITALVEAAADFAMDVLEPGGAFVAKVLAGGADPRLVALAEPRRSPRSRTSSRRRAARIRRRSTWSPPASGDGPREVMRVSGDRLEPADLLAPQWLTAIS